MKTTLGTLCFVLLLCGCTNQEAETQPPATAKRPASHQSKATNSELSSAVDKTTLVATAKKYALQDPRTADVRAKYPDILDQPATLLLLLATQDSKYHVVRFRRENPRGAAQFLEVQINLDMTLRGFKEYKQGY